MCFGKKKKSQSPFDTFSLAQQMKPATMDKKKHAMTIEEHRDLILQNVSGITGITGTGVNQFGEFKSHNGGITIEEQNNNSAASVSKGSHQSVESRGSRQKREDNQSYWSYYSSEERKSGLTSNQLENTEVYRNSELRIRKANHPDEEHNGGGSKEDNPMIKSVTIIKENHESNPDMRPGQLMQTHQGIGNLSLRESKQSSNVEHTEDISEQDHRSEHPYAEVKIQELEI